MKDAREQGDPTRNDVKLARTLRTLQQGDRIALSMIFMSERERISNEHVKVSGLSDLLFRIGEIVAEKEYLEDGPSQDVLSLSFTHPKRYTSFLHLKTSY